MRKCYQKQLLEIVKTLHGAHAEIKRLFSNKEIQFVIGLLSDCQDSAVRIGEFIERFKGERTKTVTYLEEYCDLLYQIGVEIKDSRNDTGLFKQLQKQLNIIESSIRTDLKPDKIEMLFIPHKASMWDAMESVWLAAKNDPQCDAVVMPVPYYDKNSDGTFGEIHYEGGQFPGYVPVADWRKYSLEERRPDIIVISNPYDEGNYVTSIHPHFYNKRLKDFTDLLVYIPYFVCIDDVETPFCVCAGTLFADKVIVQSEKIRGTYLREFRKFKEEHNCKDGFGKAKTKFIALGSPKFDKIINTKREDCQIPYEWRKLVERPDGSGKIVILYNTNIQGILNKNIKALHKLRCVFDCFQKRDDAVLLWRPHPLNTATIGSMRPHLLQEYLDIIEEYKRKGFGIYDDTSDMNRAIAISDAYYGDISSLVALYQCTGKPVMLQNTDICQMNDESKSLSFNNLYDDGEALWFTANDFNALFKMDKQTWKTEFVGSFPGERIEGKRLYGQITAYMGKLYFPPAFADEIAEYDIASNAYKKIKLFEPGEEAKQRISGPKFLESIQYKKWIFFVGCTYPTILRFDTETGLMDTFSEWLVPYEKLAADFDGYYFKSACVVGSNMAIAALNANAVVSFDMETCKSKVYEVGSKEYRYTGICFDGEDYWLSPRFGGPIVRWNPETIYKEYGDFPDGFDKDCSGFWNIRYCSDFVWLFPSRANMALKINIRDESILIAEEFQPECREYGFAACYIFSKTIDGVILAHTGKSNRLIEYDCVANRRREEPILISEEDVWALDGIRTNFFDKDSAECKTAWQCMFAESNHLPLGLYLAGLVHFGKQEQAAALSARQIEIYRNTTQHVEANSGKSIYAYCKQLLLNNTGGKQ